MSTIVLLAALLSSSPRPAAPPDPDPLTSRTPLADAHAIVNQRSARDALLYALVAFTRVDLPASERLNLALFAQAEYAVLYGIAPDDPPGDPEDLCRALAILDLARPLVATEEERDKVEDWHVAHIAELKADHPRHRCSSPAEEAIRARPLPSPALTPSSASSSASSSPSPSSPPSSSAPPGLGPSTRPPPTPGPRIPTPSDDGRAPRRLQVAGAAVLPLGLVALGLLGAVASRYRRDLARGDALRDELEVRPWVADDRMRMRGLLATTRRDEGLMIALGLTGAALVTAGTALLVRGGLQRRRARPGLALQQHAIGLTISGEF